MLDLDEIDAGWRITAPSHRAFWSHLASGNGSGLTDLLAGLDTPGAFWECAPVCSDNADHPFESVVLPTHAFERRRAQPGVFRGALSGPGPDVRVFANLSGDSTLIAPTATGDFPHLLAFLRNAPAALSTRFWQVAAEAVQPCLSEGRATWVSTHGLGVIWLHLRLDSRPKYYHFARYRRSPRA